MHRSELVGLDWASLPGTGTGYVTVDERGIVITLMTSKASQEAAEPSTAEAKPARMPRRPRPYSAATRCARLRDQRGCEEAAELRHSGPHSPQIGGYAAGLHPRKRPVGKEWVEGGGF